MARRTGNGFTLIEIVVALAILLVMGASVAPYLVGAVDDARVEGAIDSLEGFSDAITMFNVDVRTGTAIKPYPGKLSHLSSAIVGNSASYRDACGLVYTAANATAWSGPYINRTIPTGGIPLRIGLAQDSLVTSAALLGVLITGVTIEDATALNDYFDGVEGASDLTAGAVRWTSPDADGRVTLTYYRPMAVC